MKIAHKQLDSSTSMRRIAALGLSLATGAITGVLLTVGWGKNFRTRIARVDGLGTFYRVSLPEDIRNLNDIRTAEVAAPGASDYERIGVNSYWIASSENIDTLRNVLRQNDSSTRMEDLAVDRRHDGRLRGAMLAFLEGRNYAVFEMETDGGYCAGGFSVKLNSMDVRSVPFSAPSRPDEVYSLLRVPDLGGSPGFGSVLCTRRIIEIDLGLKPEPLKRLAEFLGIDAGLDPKSMPIR